MILLYDSKAHGTQPWLCWGVAQHFYPLCVSGPHLTLFQVDDGSGTSDSLFQLFISKTTTRKEAFIYLKFGVTFGYIKNY